MAAAEAVDAVGERTVEIFYYLSNERFLLLPPECGKCDIICYLIMPRASPATIRN
jgi:hypothetical protein